MTLMTYQEWAAARAAAMVESYKAGATLEQIGLIHQVTRERVRQILAKNGICRLDGGAHLVAQRKAAERAEQKKRGFAIGRVLDLEKYGMTTAEIAAVSPYVRAHPEHPLLVWRRWRINAKRTGFCIEIRFADWWRVWTESGKWDERGRGYGYWMARKDTSRAWTADNLCVMSGAEVTAYSYLRTPAVLRTQKRKARQAAAQQERAHA